MRKGIKFTDRRLLKTFADSALLIIILGWGLSIYGAIVVHSQEIKPQYIISYLEDKWIAQRLSDFANRPYKLVQYDDFKPLYDFTANRLAILVKEKIRMQWDLPPQLSATTQRLAEWVNENQPVAVVMKKKRLKRFTDARWQNLKVVFAGKHFALLTTPALGELKERSNAQ